VAEPTGTSLWVEYLDEDSCWAEVRRSPVGRIGVIFDSAPEVYPVNHMVDGTSIVFRTDEGNKLRGIDRSPAVCFQVDGVDSTHRTGWSVLVKGSAREVDRRELPTAVTDALHTWGIGDTAHWIRIDVTEITGRRIRRDA